METSWFDICNTGCRATRPEELGDNKDNRDNREFFIVGGNIITPAGYIDDSWHQMLYDMITPNVFSITTNEILACIEKAGLYFKEITPDGHINTILSECHDFMPKAYGRNFKVCAVEYLNNCEPEGHDACFKDENFLAECFIDCIIRPLKYFTTNKQLREYCFSLYGDYKMLPTRVAILQFLKLYNS